MKERERTYLTHVCRHRWSRQITMKVELSGAFVSCRGRLIKVLAGAARGEMGSKGGRSRVRLSDVDTWKLVGFSLLLV